MEDDMISVGSDIFVYVSNALIYKTTVKQIRDNEFLVQNNSMDVTKEVWVNKNKCFLITDIDKILLLDKLFENIVNV
jgi:hypothetical protein